MSATPSRSDTIEDCPVDDLAIHDEESLRHVALYADLKQVLRGADYRFRILPPRLAERWDTALLLNLTFWQAGDGGDVLVDRHLPADVVAHAAWHHLAAAAMPGSPPSPLALFVGESIASAFDLYLVGRLLGHSSESSFLDTQVSAMAEVASAAGLGAEDFEALLHDVAADPERAFSDLRELLVDVLSALHASAGADEALAALGGFESHRFFSLLHHFELSNWVLHARVHARGGEHADERAAEVDRALRKAPVPLDWLVNEWVDPALRQGTKGQA